MRRKQATQRERVNRPVCKQQIVPGLCHDPGLRWQRPRPMRNLLQTGAVEVVIAHGYLREVTAARLPQGTEPHSDVGAAGAECLA
jgi:hypothetical protein